MAVEGMKPAYFASANTREQLFDMIDRHGSVQGSQKTYYPDELKQLAGKAIDSKNPDDLRYITGTDGLRDAVRRVAEAEEKSAPFSKANSLEELFEIIDRHGPVKGSLKTYSPDELKEIISGVVRRDWDVRLVTGSEGLRDAVKWIMENEEARLKPAPSEGVISRAGTRSFDEAMELVGAVSAVYSAEKAQGKAEGKPWREGSLVHLPAEGEAIVVGDLHSRFNCLETILEETDFVERAARGEKIYLVCMGDYIDRPPKDGAGNDRHVETFKVLETLLELKKTYPDNVILLQGNHEQGNISPHEFPASANSAYSENGGMAYDRYMQFFQEMPLAAKTSNGVLMVHAGIASQVNGEQDLASPSEGMKAELIWSDPVQGGTGYGVSSRGAGYGFGEDVFNEFMAKVGANVLVRAHEQQVTEAFGGHLITLNSTDYKDADKAYATFDLSVPVRTTADIQIEMF